jgi:hypothetical protein
MNFDAVALSPAPGLLHCVRNDGEGDAARNDGEGRHIRMKNASQPRHCETQPQLRRKKKEKDEKKTISQTATFPAGYGRQDEYLHCQIYPNICYSEIFVLLLSGSIFRAGNVKMSKLGVF